MEIQVKEYAHYNRAMGKYIRSKAHYEEEMARGDYINSDRAKELAKKKKEEQRGKYELSKDSRDLLRGMRAKADKKGRYKLSDREADYLKSKGMDPDYLTGRKRINMNVEDELMNEGGYR